MNDFGTNGQRISLRLFGGPILEMDGEPVPLSSYQACLLSIVYGHGPDGISRSRVIDLLWDEADGSKQRHRLSQLVHVIKRKAGADVIRALPLDRLAPNADNVVCDLDSFHRHLSDHRLPEAASILQRKFLELVDPPPTHEFDRWASSLPLSLASAATQCAQRRASEARRANDWPGVARATEANLALGPKSEATLRELMHALSMAGRQGEALAALDRFMAEGNGGVQVSAETLTLRDKIRSSADDLPFGASDGRAQPVRDARLCGRDDELAGLLGRITGGTSHGLTLHLVSGEAGMGKTRLVSEVLQRARLQGFEVLTANCSEFEQAIPLNAVLDGLRGDRVTEVVRGLNDPWRAVMLSLLPGMIVEGEAAAKPPYVRPDSVPRRLYEAIQMAISELTSEQPLIMAIDNFQWADETSVSVLEFMTRRWSGGSLVLLLSYRPTTHRDESAATRFLKAQGTSKEIARTQLVELSRRPSLELVHELASEQGIDELTAEKLAVLGCGNPLFLIELTQEHLAGRLERAHGSEVPNLPISVRQIITERLRFLKPPAMELLSTLAVLGREAHPRTLAALTGTGQTTDALLDQIEDLERLRLITTTAVHVRIRHDLIQYAVYAELSSVRRAVLHGRIAKHLSLTSNSAAAELAIHFDRAGDHEQALEYALAAAERAEESGAISEAINYLTIARRNAKEDPQDHDILGRLAHLHYLHRGGTEAAALLELAVRRYREAGELERALKAEIERIKILALESGLEARDLMHELYHCRKEAELNQYWEVLASALDVAVLILERTADLKGIREVLLEAERVGERGSKRARCEAKCTQAYHILHGEPELGLLSAREAVRLAETEGFVDLLFGCRGRLISALAVHGLLETEEGLEAVTKVGALAERSGDLHSKCLLQINLGVWSLDIGELDRARTRFLQAQQLLRGLDRIRDGIMLNLNLGELSLLENELDEAVDYFDKADELLSKSPSQRYAWIREAGPGLAALRRGDLKEADVRERRLPPLPSDWVIDPTLTILFLARQMERRGQHEEALELISSTADAVKDQWVTHSIRLHLEEIPRRARTEPNRARALAHDVLDVAKALKLQKRVEELTRMIERIQ